MRAFHIFTLSILVAACLALTAAADEIRTKSGRRISGKIVKETSTEVHIKTKFGGVMKIKRSTIDTILWQKSKADEYKERAARISSRDPKAQWELALWCRVEDLGAQYLVQLKKVIALDPNHEKARKELGYVKYEGRWVKKKDLKKLKEAALLKEMKAKGLVKYKGKWVTRDDREKMKKGFMKYEGRWVTPEVREYLKKGLVEYLGEWVTKEEKENREKGLFRVGRKWVSEADANEFHSEWDTAWELKGTGYKLTSNAPIQYLEKQKRIIAGMIASMNKFCLGHKPDVEIPIHIYGTVQEYNGVQQEVFTTNMHYAHHSHSIGGVFKYTDPPFVNTYKIDTPYYQYLFLGHSIGEGYMYMTFGPEKINDLWFMLGPGHYFGFIQLGKVLFNVNHANELIKANYLPLKTLVATRELSDESTWNTRFFFQSATLVYMLYKDPRYAEKFKKFRADVFKSGNPTKLLKKHFDLDELDKSLRSLLQSTRAIPEEVKDS